MKSEYDIKNSKLEYPVLKGFTEGKGYLYIVLFNKPNSGTVVWINDQYRFDLPFKIGENRNDWSETTDNKKWYPISSEVKLSN